VGGADTTGELDSYGGTPLAVAAGEVWND